MLDKKQREMVKIDNIARPLLNELFETKDIHQTRDFVEIFNSFLWLLEEALVDGGIGSVNRFETYRKWKGYGCLMGDELMGIRPIKYGDE